MVFGEKFLKNIPLPRHPPPKKKWIIFVPFRFGSKFDVIDLRIRNLIRKTNKKPNKKIKINKPNKRR